MEGASVRDLMETVLGAVAEGPQKRGLRLP